MQQLVGYISALLSIASIVPYIRDIISRQTIPERASWFIWSVLGTIMFFSQLSKGASESLWFTAGQTIAVCAVFFLSLYFGTGGFVRRDYISLSIAGLGLYLWFITNDALYAMALTILVDASGAILTIIKSYQEPETETISTWIISGTSGLFGMIAVGVWNPILISYPLYITCINFIISAAILMGKRNKIRHYTN